MKLLVLLFTVLLVWSSVLFAAPVFKVTKDGQTNWLIGTFHDVRPTEAEVPAEILSLIKNARVVMSELGGMNQAATSQLTSAMTGARQPREPSDSLGYFEYMRLMDLLRETPINDRMFRNAHGVVLYSNLNGAFAMLEHRRLHHRMMDLAQKDPARETELSQKMRNEMFIRKINANFQYETMVSGRMPVPTFDQLLTSVADRKFIPVVALDSPTSMAAAAAEKFEGAELGSFVRARIKRLEVIDAMAPETVASTLVEFFAGIGKNNWRKFCRWDPSQPMNYGILTSNELVPVSYPKIMQKLFDRHEEWMPAIEIEFAKGNAVVVTGAGHVSNKFNPDGSTLSTLLEARGYKVEFFPTKDCD